MPIGFRRRARKGASAVACATLPCPDPSACPAPPRAAPAALQNLIFRFLQSRQKIQIWLFEHNDLRIEGRIIVSGLGAGHAMHAGL